MIHISIDQIVISDEQLLEFGKVAALYQGYNLDSLSTKQLIQAAEDHLKRGTTCQFEARVDMTSCILPPKPIGPYKPGWHKQK